MALLKANDCKDIDAYLALSRGPKKDCRWQYRSSEKPRPASSLSWMRPLKCSSPEATPTSGDIQIARRVLSQIARQGRSVGVHLVIATQRPDAKSLDPQVKANLTGVVCFQMLNDASSITVLGVGRATELPAIPGRAIWKCGAEMVEVQTPYLETEEADRALGNRPVRTMR